MVTCHHDTSWVDRNLERSNWILCYRLCVFGAAIAFSHLRHWLKNVASPMPVRRVVFPTLFSVVCSYIFLFALKGALQELKLYGTPSFAEVQCDNSFHVSTSLTPCYTEQAVRFQYVLLPCKYCEIWSYQCFDFMRLFLCCDLDQTDRHVPTFQMKNLQPFSGLWQTTWSHISEYCKFQDLFCR